MTMLTKVWMSSLVNRILTHQWKELNMFEGNTCNYSHPMWKVASHVMATNVLRTTSWVLMCLLPWTQCKKWIPIMSMGCMHMHQRIPIIEGWSSLNHIRTAMEKTKEINWKLRKISWIVNQAPAPRPEHDRIWAWWASNIPLENMLERVWWCKCSKMEFWSRPICCPMNCSNKRRHVRTRGDKGSHAALMCC